MLEITSVRERVRGFTLLREGGYALADGSEGFAQRSAVEGPTAAQPS